MMEQNLPKHIHQNRPSLILNIDNEYMTYMLMDEIKRKSILMLIQLWQSIISTVESRCLSVITSTASSKICETTPRSTSITCTTQSRL